ncbi:hypothetical protein SAMN05216267_102768 [Actinacidiphila rubida]|uniref:Transposase n=1 Tax=Actinacidiphila rubida TaxID=310780 RepID=A0A1H8PYE7_9ACTN|nr:hypothetical protein SAMN05216267_102768 [Actinacidiphila rubida]
MKYHFYPWRNDGTDQVIHDLLRWQIREKRGRLADPSLVALDTQSLHAPRHDHNRPLWRLGPLATFHSSEHDQRLRRVAAAGAGQGA